MHFYTKRFVWLQKYILAIIIAALSLQPIIAQPGVSPYYKAPDSLAGKTIVIPAGTTFEGLIESTIGSSVSKQGERFVITLSSPILANGSEVLIPAGAEVLGEVVQAIPAKDVPHAKKEKPPGKLRVEVTALKMPNGMTYPMVASLIGERTVRNTFNPYNQFNAPPPERGSGVAYVGTATGFESITPGKARYDRNGAPSVVTRNELLNDPVMGRDRSISDQRTEIRSLVKKERNLYIYKGSPLTIRLEAPFRMGIGSSAGEESALELQTPKIKPPSANFSKTTLPQSPIQVPAQPQTNKPNTVNTKPPQTNNQDSNF